MDQQPQTLTVQKQKFPWLILVLALLIGFFASQFFFRKDTVLIAPKITDPAKIDKTVKADESQANSKVDSLTTIARHLEKIAVDQKYNSQNLNALYAHFSDSAIAYVQRMHAAGNDYEDGNTAQVVSQIKYLREVSDKKDSVCTARADTLNSLIGIKTATIAVKDSEYKKLRINYDTLSSQQKNLISYSDKQTKALRRKKVGSAFLKAGIVILGGVILKSNIIK